MLGVGCPSDLRHLGGLVSQQQALAGSQGGLRLLLAGRNGAREMGLIERQAARSMGTWRAGLPAIAAKPTDREARDWVEGWSASLWITDVERLAAAEGVELVWAPGPWTEPQGAVIFTLVLRAVLLGRMRETCPMSHRSGEMCPGCGHVRGRVTCGCWSCARATFSEQKEREA